MKHIHYYILGVVMLILAASCSSTRKMASAKESVWKTNECVSARANMSLSSQGSGNVSLGGSLKMRRDDIIQVSATYLLGIPVGNIEFTRDSVMVVSRATRQYAALNYQELSLLMGRNITFLDFQNIFWGEAGNLEVKGVDWKYNTFTKLSDGRQLPEEFDISLSRGPVQVKATLKLSGHKVEEALDTRQPVNTSRYSRLSADQLVKLISILLGK